MDDNSRRKQLRADLLLFFIAFSWGASYGLTSISIKEVDNFNLIAIRFIGAFLIAASLSFKKLKNVNLITFVYSAVIGFLLFLVYILSNMAIIYTSLSNAGFLCALPVVITPILSFFIFKRVPSKKFLLVVLMSITGIGLLTLNSEFKFASGDLMAIGCATVYAVDLIVTENAVGNPQVNAFQLGVLQILFTGVFASVFALFVEGSQLPKTPKVWGAIIFLTIFCTGLSFIGQAIAQQYTSASHVGVIFTAEPVFAGLVAFVVFDEVLPLRSYIGAVILLSSLLIMEVQLPKKKKDKKLLNIRKQ